MKQLSDMAAKGEIGKDEIRNVEYTLMSARRKGQLDARKNEPGYADKKAASLAKATATKAQSKKDSEIRKAKFDAESKADAQAEQERRSTNKLPLSMSAYRMGVKGTKKALGDFAKYYSDKFNPAGPGGQDSYSLELKPKFKDQSFDDAKNAWDFYDGKKPSSLNEEFTRMKKLAGLITENIEYTPYQFDDERGKELYKKYEKADENPAWKNIDGNYEKVIKLDTLLKITGMSLAELEELNTYSDESWSLFIDEMKNTVTQSND
jgi:hypothetical protein